MRIVIVFNPVSGSGRSAAVAERLARELAQRGLACARVPTERRDPSDWLDPALVGADLLLVAGGDGTIRMTAASAARAGVAVWHAPCGTENLFARAFGMSHNADAIARAIGAWRTRRIDLGDAGGVSFAIMASAGFDAAVVRRLSQARVGAISHWSYAMPILRAMGSWRAPEVEWVIDGERESLGRGLVVVGNMREYGARLNPAAEAKPDDGLLDAVFLPSERAVDLLPWLPLLWTGLHLRHPALRVRRAALVAIECSEPTEVQFDGDPGPDGAVERLTLSVRRGALSVLLPA